MKKIVVYYGTPKGVRVSIDDGPPTNTQIATNQLIKGKVRVAVLQRERQDPVGIFAPSGAEYTLDKGGPLIEGETGPGLPPIDYNIIEPNEFKLRLESRLQGLSKLNYLVDPEFEVRCIKGVPEMGR
jgi:hypothetical protein